MQFVAALNLITMLTGALQGLFNMIGAAVPVSDIIADHVAKSTYWTDEERAKVVDALRAAKAKADQQITDAGG